MTTQLIIKLHFLVVDKYPMMLQSLATPPPSGDFNGRERGENVLSVTVWVYLNDFNLLDYTSRQWYICISYPITLFVFLKKVYEMLKCHSHFHL